MRRSVRSLPAGRTNKTTRPRACLKLFALSASSMIEAHASTGSLCSTFASRHIFIGVCASSGISGGWRCKDTRSSWHRAGSREVHGLADPDGYADSQSAGFPGDQTVFDVDFPAAGAGAVYPVGRADDFVMLPTLAISILPVTVGIEKLAMPIGKGFTLLFEVAKPVRNYSSVFSCGSLSAL